MLTTCPVSGPSSSPKWFVPWYPLLLAITGLMARRVMHLPLTKRAGSPMFDVSVFGLASCSSPGHYGQRGMEDSE
jgi:hypothetical protein